MFVDKVDVPASTELVFDGGAVSGDEVCGPLGFADSVLDSEANAESFADGKKEGRISGVDHGAVGVGHAHRLSALRTLVQIYFLHCRLFF